MADCGAERPDLRWVWISGSLLVCVAPALRAAEGDVLQEVVVTATKQEQPLDKVPISVAAYTSETMDRLGVRDVNDIARLTPGLDFSQNTFGSGSQNNIAIRGVTSNSGAATTGIYIDDVAIQERVNPASHFGTGFPEVFDLERVEVLRGPQGTLFGAGAEGGAVRFITPAPSLSESSLYARTEFSGTAHGGLNYEAGVAGGVPLMDGVLGLRASAWTRHDGGFVDRQPYGTTRTFDNVNHDQFDVFRVALAYEPAAGLRFTPAVYYQRVSAHDSGNFWSTLSDADSGRFISGAPLQQPARDRFVMPSLKIEWALPQPALTVTSVSAYFDRSAWTLNDYTVADTAFITQQPFPLVPGQNAPGTATVGQQLFSQELRLNYGDPAARVRWTLGGFYSHAIQTDGQHNQDLFASALYGAPLENIFGEPLTEDRYLFIALGRTLDEQKAVFGQVDVKLTDRLTVTAGARYSHTTLDFQQTLAGPLNYKPGGPDFQTNGAHQDANPVTPRFGLNFQADDDNLLYASVGKGFRVGGVNPPLSSGFGCLGELAKLGLSAVPLTYGPDSTWSYEIGSKNRLLGGALRLEESAFLINWSQIQQFVGFPACGGAGFTGNLGSARSRGFDLQASARLNAMFSLTAAVGYTDTRYLRTVGTDTTVVVRKGDTLPGAPWKGTLALDSTLPLGGGEAYAHVEDQYRSHNGGRQASQDDPLAAGYDPSIGLDPAVNELNLRIGFIRSGVDASLFINNVLDSAPLLGITHDLATSPLFYYNTIRPRTIGLTVTLRR